MLSRDNNRDGYVSRGALKLKFAVEQFNIDVRGKVAADLGCSTGGFTEVLLEKGAGKVYAVDTAYGQLDWKLRNDRRVVVMERNNALHVKLPEKVDIVTVDAGWTTQKLIIPKAKELLDDNGEIISLVKPHYEARGYGIRFRGGKLDDEESEKVFRLVIEDLKNENYQINKYIKSPVTGDKGKNIEYLIWISIKTNNRKKPDDAAE